jgi:hypothetical protein
MSFHASGTSTGAAFARGPQGVVAQAHRSQVRQLLSGIDDVLLQADKCGAIRDRCYKVTLRRAFHGHLCMLRLPTHSAKTYEAMNCCVYCRATHGLSDEHIIPLGLGGRWLLPRSSCANCSAKSAAFERTCQRTMWGPLRMYFDLPSRRPGERPKTLPLKVKITPDADWTFIDVDQEVYPFLVLFPVLPLPSEVSGKVIEGERGAVVKTLWIRGASFRDGIMPHLNALAAELKVAEIEPRGRFIAPEFFRLMAKIAHAFAMAELGKSAFSPFLRPMICEADTSNSRQYIGGFEHTEPATGELHELSIWSHRRGEADIVVVRIRLLASLETPTYHVAVGHTIDAIRIAKAAIPNPRV